MLSNKQVTVETVPALFRAHRGRLRPLTHREGSCCLLFRWKTETDLSWQRIESIALLGSKDVDLFGRKEHSVADDDDTMAFKKIPQRNATPTTVNTVQLFKSHASLKQNCDPVLGALGPALSNPDKVHLPSASLPISRHVAHSSRSVWASRQWKGKKPGLRVALLATASVVS